MKNILLLILLGFTSLVASQENKPFLLNGKLVYPLSGEELDRIYERDAQCEFTQNDLDSCKETAKSLVTIISNLRTEINKGTADLRQMKAEKDSLQVEKEKMIAERAKLSADRKTRILLGGEFGTNPQFEKPIFKANIDVVLSNGGLVGSGFDNNRYFYVRYSKTLISF